MNAWWDWKGFAPTLFPLVGAIQRLRIFPAGFRAVFITISTLLGTGVFLGLYNQFQALPFFLPSGFVLVIGTILILAYLAIYLIVDRSVYKSPSWRRAVVVITLLVLFSGAIVAFTYAFNVVVQLGTYDVYRGRVLLEASQRGVPGAEVIFSFPQKDETCLTGRCGAFLAILPKASQTPLRSIRVKWQDPENYQLLGQTIGPAGHDRYMTITIGPIGERQP